MKSFVDLSQQALQFSSQLKTVKDLACQHQIHPHDEHVFTFIATLDTNGESPVMVYNVTCDNTPIYALSELPPTVLAAYGIFVGHVEGWKYGGELHESLRHDD